MGDSRRPRKNYEVGLRKKLQISGVDLVDKYSEIICFVESDKPENYFMIGDELWFKITEGGNLQAIKKVEIVGYVLSPEKEVLIERINRGYNYIGSIDNIKSKSDSVTILTVRAKPL